MPNNTHNSISTIEAPTLEAMKIIASTIATRVQAGDVIALMGELGTGKTVFARAFIHTLCGELEVPSPTFTLVQTYGSPGFPVHHFDLYRLNQPDDVYELGFDDALDHGVTLIEWPEIIMDMLPAERLEIQIEHGTIASARIIHVCGNDEVITRLCGTIVNDRM